MKRSLQRSARVLSGEGESTDGVRMPSILRGPQVSPGAFCYFGRRVVTPHMLDYYTGAMGTEEGVIAAFEGLTHWLVTEPGWGVGHAESGKTLPR